MRSGHGPWRVWRHALAAAIVAASAWATAASAADAVAAADAVPAGATVLRLHGTIHDRDAHSYVQVPFDVPQGTARLSVRFDHGGREDKTVIDLGLLDPHGFRGWSGGSKREFTVAASDATPSYLPGTLPAGRWQLLLGIPNIRPGRSADYTAFVTLTPRAHPEAVPDALTPVLRVQPGWYRGDLHMHSAHSDASCASRSGTRVPCPLFLTLQAASAAGLDFVALTDHNTVSHLQPIRELQPYFDDLLLIPGMELTTFQGHANVFGLQDWIDFRLGSAPLPDWNAVLDEVQRRGLLLSINHPRLPNDERCMGCGWTPEKPVAMERIAVVEAVNGQDAGTPVSGIPFWHALLDRGQRVTGVGGSDNHDATRREVGEGATTPVGHPATVVHAAALSQAAILDGIRAGRVFIDVQGSRDRKLELSLDCGQGPQPMGAELVPRDGTACQGTVEVDGLADARVELLLDGDGQAIEPRPVAGQAGRWRFDWQADGHRHWLRANVHDAQDRLALVGNPVYVKATP